MAAYFKDINNETLTISYIDSYVDKSIVNKVYFAQLGDYELERGLRIIGRVSVPDTTFTFVGDDAKMIFVNW
jgi:hypothetical protein